MSKFKNVMKFESLSRTQLSSIKGAGSKIPCADGSGCPSHMTCSHTVGQGWCEKKYGYN